MHFYNNVSPLNMPTQTELCDDICWSTRWLYNHKEQKQVVVQQCQGSRISQDKEAVKLFIWMRAAGFQCGKLWQVSRSNLQW